MTHEAVILSAVRTPIGSFGGALATVGATQLGAVAVKAAVSRAGIDPTLVDEVFMGNVVSANLGQAPARQAALFGGLPNTVPCTTVNKVCSSGLKAVMLAAQSIRLGDNQIVVAGGMESMSNIPHYLPAMRNGLKLGDAQVVDGMVKDGLWEVYNNYHMGNAAELCAREFGFSREAQDAYAVESYRRSAAAHDAGRFADEIVPVEIAQRKGQPAIVAEDEEFRRVNFEKIPSLRPVFDKNGTVTAANASTINDGAAAFVVANADVAKQLGIKPIARIVAYADAAHQPEWFTTAPAKAIEKALAKAGLSVADIDFWEINEAFAAVVLAGIQQLGLDAQRVNVHGGAISLGHPLGASGARILVTLTSVLQQHQGRYGVAALCNGGGGASAMIIERL